ncbi:MAG: hypothetical protein ACLPID_19395 [Beijerinckiaceae bacterium]
MMKDLPRPDMSRFSQIAPEVLILCYLLGLKQAISIGVLKARLKAFASSQKIEDAVATLIADHRAVVNKSIELTQEGKDAAKKALGRDAGEEWEKIWQRRLLLKALGLNPDDGETRKKFATADAQKAATIAVSYNLNFPKEIMASKPSVCTELVWRTLKARLPDVIGDGPFPPLQPLGTVERVVLAGLANMQARTITEAVDGVAAAAIGLQKCDIDTFRKGVIALAVERASTALPSPPDDSFAARIMHVAEKLTTPPFQGRVAIAQIYDAYGRVHPDAGSLQSFKARLVEAAEAQKILLGRLDLPERMDKDLRLRSETSWGTNRVHFVITERN